MMFAIILHLFTGAYMLSNQEIFAYHDDEDFFGIWFVRLLGRLIEALFGIEKERFLLPHTIVYMLGIIIFVICFWA